MWDKRNLFLVIFKYINQSKLNLFLQLIDTWLCRLLVYKERSLFTFLSHWHVKSFYRLSKKFKQKYNIFHVNNLKSNVQFTFKQQFKVKKNNNWSYLLFKTCPIIIVFASIAIWERLVIYFSLFPLFVTVSLSFSHSLSLTLFLSSKVSLLFMHLMQIYGCFHPCFT